MAAIDVRPMQHSRWLPRRFEIDNPRHWQPVLKARELLVLFDFDGTLVEIAPTPTAVLFSEARKRMLGELLSLPQCMAGVVSGRTIDELRRLIGLSQMFYVGCHGMEWSSPEGERYMSWPDRVRLDALRSLRQEMRAAAADFPGVVLEDKDLALAFHYRQAAPDTALAARREFVRAVSWYQQQGVNLELLTGKEVIEAKLPGATKGDAVGQIWARYAPTAFPIYIGDDVTDEGAFSVIANAGLSILVAAKPQLTSAAFYLANPSEVCAFLTALIRIRQQGMIVH